MFVVTEIYTNNSSGLSLAVVSLIKEMNSNNSLIAILNWICDNIASFDFNHNAFQFDGVVKKTSLRQEYHNHVVVTYDHLADRNMAMNCKAENFEIVKLVCQIIRRMPIHALLRKSNLWAQLIYIPFSAKKALKEWIYWSSSIEIQPLHCPIFSLPRASHCFLLVFFIFFFNFPYSHVLLFRQNTNKTLHWIGRWNEIRNFENLKNLFSLTVFPAYTASQNANDPKILL